VSSRKSKATRRQERATRAQADPLPDAARPRPRARRLALLIVLVLLGGGGLLWWNRSRAASGAARAALDVPDPPTAGLEVPVQEIIAQARTNLLARLGSADAWGWYASVLDAHELYAEAEPCYRRAHELAPSDVRFGYNLALVLESLGADPDRSLELYREVARQEPTFPPVHVHIAYNLSRKGDLEGASAAYQTALALDPKLWVVRRSLARLWIENQDFARAAAELERVAAAVPGDGPTQAALAQAYAGLGDQARASAASLRASGLPEVLTMPDPIRFQVRQQGRSSQLALERADARVVDGDYAGVVEDLKLVLRSRPGSAKIHERLAEAYGHLGQTALRDQELAEARRLRPQH